MKKSFRILAIIMLVAVMLLTLSACQQVGLEKGDYSTVYDIPMPQMELKADGSFEILQLTDIHLLGTNSKSDSKTMDGIEGMLKAKKYDLVMLTGDVFEGFTNKAYDKAKAAEKLVALFDKYSQKFTIAMGNNDGELLGSREDIVCTLLKSDNFVFADTKDVDGVGNFYIKLMDVQGVEKHRLVVMDSSMRADGEYVPMGNNQVEYYNTIAKDCKSASIQLSLFMHIPFHNLGDVLAKGQAFEGDLNVNGIKTLYDMNYNGNSELYAAVKDSGVCKLIVNGHMHSIDIAKIYDGMLFKVTRAGMYAYKLPAGAEPGGAGISIATNAIELESMYKIATLNY